MQEGMVHCRRQETKILVPPALIPGAVGIDAIVVQIGMFGGAEQDGLFPIRLVHVEVLETPQSVFFSAIERLQLQLRKLILEPLGDTRCLAPPFISSLARNVAVIAAVAA